MGTRISSGIIDYVEGTEVTETSTQTATALTANKTSALIIVENLPVPFDRRVWHEATTLQRAGYEVSVICPATKGYTELYEVIEGVHVYRHPLPPEGTGPLGYLREYLAALFWEFRLSRRVKRERGFQIIHICNPPDLLFLVAGMYKIFGGARVIFDHHDVNPELYEEKFKKRGLFYWLLKTLERLTMLTADVVISTNDSYKQIALQRGGKNSEDVFIVRSAPDIDRFKAVEPDPGLRRHHDCIVGYVGVMAEQDGVDTVLHVAHEIVHLRGRTDIGFLLIGGGPEFDQLNLLSRELGVEDHVHFAGFQSGENLLRHLSSCDIGISPDPISTYNNMCTMNKTLEYMALGLPVVQFELTEGRVSAGDASLYVASNDVKLMADAVQSLADDEALRQALGQRGRERIRTELSWKHQVPELLKAYERALLR